MTRNNINKRKIINDPVSGFINLQSDLVFDLIEHRFFQRLRRIKQLGLSYLVYPGANHTRFEHALGALHLMRSAIDSLKNKGIAITPDEAEAVSITILLHDIGHGPFSHALEYSLVTGIPHELMSLVMMEKMNEEFGHQLDLAIQIFKNSYQKRFLHQLVASQLDMDRLDYLRRDSFYSGVIEGAIGSDRIIKMLNVRGDKLVVDKKGIYSIEKFLIARRLMYWQVYLHKTVIAAEHMLIKILQRAKELVSRGDDLFCPPQLFWLLKNNITRDDLLNSQTRETLIENFILLDDSDIMCSIKVWCSHPDPILSFLARSITNRKLLKIKISDSPFKEAYVREAQKKAAVYFNANYHDAAYFVFQGEISNSAYEPGAENILIVSHNNETADLRDASDINLDVLSKSVKKHFLCYPRVLEIN